MGAKLEKIENSEAYLDVEVDAETLEQGLEKAYRKVVQKVNLPGFRKGKAPRTFLEAHYGKEILFEDALELVIPDAYEKALVDLEIEPIANPEFDIGEIKPGEVLQFKVKVAVKPEVILGKMEGLEVSVPIQKISEADIDDRMEDMRSRYAKLIEKTEDPSELGDTVTIDFAGFIDDTAFEGGTGEDYQLELGSNTFIPGFEEQLIGLRAGDSKEVKVVFPESYHAEDLAGKDAVFKTTIKKIEHKELRQLDDEFAQEVSEFDSVAELRNDIKANLEKANDHRQKEIIKREVLAKAAEECTIEIPQVVIENQVQTILGQFEQRLGSQGINLEQYFQLTKSNLHEFRQDMLPEAERTVKTNYILEKLVEEKGFELTDEEIDKQIEEMAAQMGIDLEQAKQNLEGVWDNIKYNMKVEKAIQYLVDNAVISEKEASAQGNEIEVEPEEQVE
ncbi:MAG: trigger factor [Syntrophomonas sp.]|nr:trigger factor [Syntrophomonas sp.]